MERKETITGRTPVRQDRRIAIWSLGLFVGTVASFFWGGCAPQEQVSMMERRINGLALENRSLAARVGKLEQEMASLREEAETVGKQDMASVRSRQAETVNRLDQVQAEILRLGGLIDQMGFSAEREKAENNAFQVEMKERIGKIEEEMGLLQASAKTTAVVEQARKKAAEGAVDLYQKALDLMKQKDYKEAKKTLQTYVEKNPGGDRVPNAYFWMGECEYNLERYEEAILEYQKVISKYSGSNKVPDALLKQGISFAMLGDNESAKIVLNKLVRQFPKSSQAGVAKKQLARLP